MSSRSKNENGFSLIEVIASMVLLGFITANVITMFGEIDKTNSKIDRKLGAKDLYQSLKSSLKDPAICLANFNGLNSNVSFKSRELFMNAAKSVSYKTMDADFNNIVFKLNEKTQLFENNYVANLEVVRNKSEDLQLKIPVFFKVTAGNVSNCSTVLNSTGKVISSVCDSNNVGATKLSAPDPKAYGYLHTLICNGFEWMAADPNGGFFTRYLQNSNQCKTPNPITGQCSCPTHYKMAGLLGFANQGNCALKDGISDRMYDDATDTTYVIPDSERTENCGWLLVQCIPSTI